jgi:hypothetical protein
MHNAQQRSIAMQNEERINGLENQVRTLKRIVYGFGCLLIAGVIVSATSLQTVPDVIQAKKFEVVNDEGKAVAILAGASEGGTFTILNNEGQKFASIVAKVFGGDCHFYNKDNGSAVWIGAGPMGAGILALNNRFNNPCVLMGSDIKGNGVIRTVDTKGEFIFQSSVE